jgi:hypothetical protein
MILKTLIAAATLHDVQEWLYFCPARAGYQKSEEL